MIQMAAWFGLIAFAALFEPWVILVVPALIALGIVALWVGERAGLL